MFRHICFLLIFFCISLSAAEKLLLWEGKHPAYPGKFFFAGSIHFGNPSLYPLDSAYDKALHASDVLVMEIFQEDEQKENSSAMQFIMRKAFYPAGKDLVSVLGEKEFGELLSYYRGNGVMADRNLTQRRRPWFITLELAQIFCLKMKFDPQYGFEKIFRDHWRERPGRGLENIFTQLSLLEGTDEKELCRVIMETVRGEDRNRKELEAMLACFRTGDITALAKLEDEFAGKYPLFHKRLLLMRNQAMAEKLAGYAKEKKTFFILAGAMHFAGKKNILELLSARGFQIRQLHAEGKKGGIRIKK